VALSLFKGVVSTAQINCQKKNSNVVIVVISIINVVVVVTIIITVVAIISSIAVLVAIIISVVDIISIAVGGVLTNSRIGWL
jgi:hypothetical protein